jgi:hypothetical protein
MFWQTKMAISLLLMPRYGRVKDTAFFRTAINLREKCSRKLRKQANYGFVSFPKTVDCSLLPYIPVHLVIHLEHPLREFSFCIGDELFGHLTIKSVCHRAGNGAKRVGIAAQRDGQLESAVRVASSMHSSLLRAIKPAAETRMPLPLPKE